MCVSSTMAGGNSQTLLPSGILQNHIPAPQDAGVTKLKSQLLPQCNRMNDDSDAHHAVALPLTSGSFIIRLCR